MNRAWCMVWCVAALAAMGCASQGSDGSGSGGSSAMGNAASGAVTSSAGGSAFVPPSVVSIRITSSMVRPWDTQQETWDFPTQVPQSDIDQLNLLLGQYAPYAKVAEWIGQLAADQWSPPDAYGFAYLYVNGVQDPSLNVTIPETPNQFAQSFMSVGWDHVPVDPNMRFGIHLVDDDSPTTADDPIGDVELNYDDVIEAVKQKQVVPIKTSDQDLGTILFVGLTAVPEQ